MKIKMSSSFSLNDVQIYYINLDTRTDRRENVEKRLNLFNLKAERKSAVTPDKVTLPFQNQSISDKQKACTQSHIEILKKFLASDQKYLLILEDDNRFRKDWVEVVNKKLTTINQEDPDWHCLYLYTTEGMKHYSLSNAGIPMDDEDKKMFGVWRRIQEHFSAASILYSRKGVQEFFSMFNDFTGYHTFDWMTWNLQYKGHSYGIFPWLMCIDGTGSSINNQDGLDADFRKAMKLLKEADFSYDNYE
jgi:GR25 family glycosyltransferase involved in LPS biosynthesis